MDHQPRSADAGHVFTRGRAAYSDCRSRLAAIVLSALAVPPSTFPKILAAVLPRKPLDPSKWGRVLPLLSAREMVMRRESSLSGCGMRRIVACGRCEVVTARKRTWSFLNLAYDRKKSLPTSQTAPSPMWFLGAILVPAPTATCTFPCWGKPCSFNAQRGQLPYRTAHERLTPVQAMGDRPVLR